jgi:omega-6 fatty acid desaturase (delta-12 desaturase)
MTHIELAPNPPLSLRQAAGEDRRSFPQALWLLTVHFGLYAATLAGTVAPLPLGLTMLFSVANGVFIALLFIIAHDGAHGSFVPGRRANRWIARLAFVPCVHAASQWVTVHNQRHHARTNLKGVDSVWAPMSKAEYDAANPARRALERVYRGAWGPVVYYYIEFWLHRMLLPLAPEVRSEWRRHLPDSLFALAGFALTLAFIVVAAQAWTPERPLWQVLLFGWVIPYAVWSYLMAFTIYLNHTHPEIPWFGDEATWRRFQGKCRESAFVKLPVNAIPLYSKVNAHPAHHARMTVPVYALAEVQAALQATSPTTVEYLLTPKSYMEIVRTCKLFDFERLCWTGFDGTPTTPPLVEKRAPVPANLRAAA